MTRKPHQGGDIDEGVAQVIALAAPMREKRQLTGERAMPETSDAHAARELLEDRIAFYTSWNLAQPSTPEPKNAGSSLDAALDKAERLAVNGGFSNAVALADASSKPSEPPPRTVLTDKSAQPQAAEKK
jgi:hypothetical protein